MEKAALSTQDKDRARDFVKLNNAVEFMSSEESDEDGGQTNGPSARDVKRYSGKGANYAILKQSWMPLTRLV